MFASIICCFVCFFKTKSEVIEPSFLGGIEIITGTNLSEKGKIYRSWYWRLFFLTFLLAAITVLFMYLFVPEFQQEINNVSKSI